MAEALSLDNLFTLAMLVFLQAVLGFDTCFYRIWIDKEKG